MSIFRRRPKLENPELIERIRHRAIKYVTTRDENNVELVLGRSGGINIRDDEIIVFSEGRDVFRCNIYRLSAGELLSRDGVRLSYTDDDGKTVSVIAHYV